MVTVPEQLPNVLDRAIRTAMAERAPTAIIIPADVQELEYSAPTHAFKMVPSSIGTDWPVVAPDDHAILKAAEVLNSGSKVAILAGQGARGARRELEEVAELLGAGVAKPLLGKDVLSDELPYVTGSIGLLGTRPSYAGETNLALDMQIPPSTLPLSMRAKSLEFQELLEHVKELAYKSSSMNTDDADADSPVHEVAPV